jgi:hypothetical protein
LNRFDECVVDKAVEALKRDGYRPSVLVEQIAMSFPFRHRFYPKVMVQAAAEAPAEVEEVGCDCGHGMSNEANELLGFFPPETKEWDNVTSEELVHE